MGIFTCAISFILFVASFFEKKKRILNPIVLFFAIWFGVVFLSNLNLYNIIKPSSEAYLLILLMLVFFYIGNITHVFINKKIKRKTKKESVFWNKINGYLPKKDIIIYILGVLVIIFNIIDIIILVKYAVNGTPLWKIRNWQLSPIGTDNPILNRRSFLEESVRNIILQPFIMILPPIAAYKFFFSKNRKNSIIVLILSVLVLITTSIAGGGGRIGFIYYFGSFLIAFLIKGKNHKETKKNQKKNFKMIIIMLILGIGTIAILTICRTGFGNLMKQAYTYFALPPTLLTVWLPQLKEVPHTYGLLTFFGVHSYFFRILETIGLNNFVPNIYKDAFTSLLSAEKFRDVGYGNANAFVTPIFYFYIDGGYPFVCILSFLFGFALSNIYEKFYNNINIKSFVIYVLSLYGVFVSFARIQTAIPQFILSFIFAILIANERDCNINETENIVEDDIEIDNQKKISIVIPVYNVEKYLEKCIESVINQTYNNLEIILVDDGSPDNCGSICDEYSKKDGRIKVIHQFNGGLSNARNTGIRNATGSYITFIDSDDYVDNSYVEVLYRNILQHNSDMSIGTHKVIYDNSVIDKATHDEFQGKPEEILKRMLYDQDVDVSAWGKLYKIELFRNIEFPEGRLYEDAATTYKLIDTCRIVSVKSESLYNYTIRKNSISQCEFSQKKMDLITSTREMTDYIKEKYPNLEKACRRRLMYAYLSTLSQLVNAKCDNKEIENKLMRYIKENRNKVIIDRNIPKRDFIGLLTTYGGYKLYKRLWLLYSKITGRY